MADEEEMEVEKESGKDAPRFVVKKWNAVTFWSWDICTGEPMEAVSLKGMERTRGVQQSFRAPRQKKLALRYYSPLFLASIPPSPLLFAFPHLSVRVPHPL